MTAYRGLRLVAVYDADGGVRGEAAYVLGKLLGTAHCSLCDITHGLLGRKRVWDVLVADLGVPIELLHRNEQDQALRLMTEGRLPCVVALPSTASEAAPAPGSPAEGNPDESVVLLTAGELEACQGDVAHFGARLRTSLAEKGFLAPPSAS
jgi:hypothetical protein